MIPPTPLQAKALAAISRLTRGGVSPSLDELATHLGLSSRSGAHRVIEMLKRRGLVTVEPGVARSLRIVGRFDGLEDMTTAELDVLRARIDAVLAGRSQ